MSRAVSKTTADTEVVASQEIGAEEPESRPFEAVIRHEERLQKIIAAAGVTSRRKAEELILEGRVQINGKTVTELGTKADPALDHIRVDGKLLRGVQRLRYAVLNKPKGYITSASDPEGRPTVMEFFPGGPRVFPVGRLDYQSEGLLVMTNDGELANLLTRAANKVQKVYLVKVSGKPSDEAIGQLRAGIMIDKGRSRDDHAGRVLTQPAGIRRVRDAENPWYEVTLTEGRNREIRKMFEEVGHFVEKIRRVGYGPLVLDVEPGEVRELTAEEVLALQRAARGIRTIARGTHIPVSIAPIRRKSKRPAVAGPVLRERPKPADRPALASAPAKSPGKSSSNISTGAKAGSGRRFQSNPVRRDSGPRGR
ncbi:Ribosomal large subunit pseudouridine synthase B [Acidisarcina polymorpha]|uniref:Pseudouridine synthase n=2 Tax=Acidisarcina polymorpha TaxID=2211140 RepID=A0A2Z5G3P0_9BACT|nr:Ribosomal large subunit pseudouridine synthase B [Acidisarcina polymorpha]